MSVDNLAVLLRVREEELSAIYENIPGILFYIAVEPEGEFRFLSVSRDFLVATGLTREQIVGSLVRDVILPSSRDMVLNHYREAIASGQTVRWEEESVYPPGWRYGEVAVTPLYDARGVATHLIGFVHDVKKLMNLEQALRQREERMAFLLRLNDALRPLSDPLDVQEVAARLLGEHLRVNRAGYAEIADGQYVIRREYVNGVPPLAGIGPTSSFGSRVREVYMRGEPVAVNDVSTDSRFSDSDRALYLKKQIAALVGVMLLKGGRLVAAFGVNTSTPRVWTAMEVELIREVAERTWAAVEHAHAEAQLRKAHDTLERRVRERTAELEARNAQLRRLASQLILTEQRARERLANTLHDHFQQLLYSATLKLDRAARRGLSDDQLGLLQQARANISEAVEVARTLSVDLFPRLHTGGLPVALAWLAKRTQQQYGITVNVTVDARADPEARDVRTLIFESVRELLFNAVKHAHVDRVDIDLVFGADDTIHLDVTDKGVGFDPALVVHQRDHVGLGLFSIQERLALFGGRLDIQSAPGKGALFSLIIPRADLAGISAVTMPAAADIRQDGVVSRKSDNRTAKPLRILIADDHAVLRTGLRELFGERPELQVVAEATNGVEAISLTMSQHPDVIVMDVSMPQMDGIEATRQIHAALPHIEIVGLSTYVDENIERAICEAGAKAYFTKNESSDRLLNYLLSLRTRAKGASESSSK